MLHLLVSRLFVTFVGGSVRRIRRRFYPSHSSSRLFITILAASIRHYRRRLEADARSRYIHVRRAVLNEKGAVDVQKYKLVARMGDISYGTIGDVYRMPAPSWEEVEPLLSEEMKRDQRS